MNHSVQAAPGALRTLVAGVVDYAGLFPPASLSMNDAVANHAAYRASDDAWMLGRFVVPVSRLAEWESSVAQLSPDQAHRWHGARLSVLLSGEFAVEAEQISAFNARSPFGVRIDVAEARTNTPDSVLATAAAMPDEVMLYCELPHRDDPRELVAAVKSAQVRAKIRTGGVTPDAFPSPAEIVRFLRRCHEAGVTAKATAGLHHPLRGEFRLTYADDAPRGAMYGYLNVFLAAAAIRAGASDDVASAILGVTDMAMLSIVDGSITIAGVALSADVLGAMRAEGVVAFGSCSFREPVDELRVLGALV
ncbi:MAG: hypothetical protein U5K74_01025 [Gemmatimonadaceae bacterium]|nr:hypothetical protein [Gemmatimonadaceae bacterium]